MNFIGNWKIHSVGQFDPAEGFKYVSVEEYINTPADYIDPSDTEAVEAEKRERLQNVSVIMKVCDDNRLYILMPFPEGVSQETIDAAVQAGEISIMDGMIAQTAMDWEERDGHLWFNSGIEGEVAGEAADPWVDASEDEGFLTVMIFRFIKVD